MTELVRGGRFKVIGKIYTELCWLSDKAEIDKSKRRNVYIVQFNYVEKYISIRYLFNKPFRKKIR